MLGDTTLEIPIIAEDKLVQDKELQEVYCAWMNEKHPEDAPVKEVEFTYSEGYAGYSEWTPGEESSISISYRDKDGKWKGHTRENMDDDSLIQVINEITQFSIKHKGE